MRIPQRSTPPHRSAERHVAALLILAALKLARTSPGHPTNPSANRSCHLSNNTKYWRQVSGAKNVDKKHCCFFCRNAVCSFSPIRLLRPFLHIQHSTFTKRMFFGIAPPGLDNRHSYFSISAGKPIPNTIHQRLRPSLILLVFVPYLAPYPSILSLVPAGGGCRTNKPKRQSQIFACDRVVPF